MRALLLALVSLFRFSAAAQTYPTSRSASSFPTPPGGTSDILARQIGPKLTEAWGQPVIVENKPGANGNVGADFVAKSAPDGYTLLLTDLGGLVISASVYPKLPFNPSKDFTPVVMVRTRRTCSRCIPSAGEEREGAGRARRRPTRAS